MGSIFQDKIDVTYKEIDVGTKQHISGFYVEFLGKSRGFFMTLGLFSTELA